MHRVLNTLRAALFVLALLGIGAQAQTPGTDPAIEAKVAKISEYLRCLVCQNQSIAESNAELAQDLRRQVREMLVAGKSEEEITDFMVERYGDFVLYQPPVKTTTFLLWAGPTLLMVLALGGFALTLRRRRRELGAARLTEAERAAARALLDPTENTNKT